MTWQHHFNRARRSTGAVTVDKNQVGPIPPDFEQQGIALKGVWGTYERDRGVETIQIRELPAQYRVSVSNLVGQNSPLAQPASNTQQQSPSLKKVIGGGIGILGLAALGKAIRGSGSSSAPDPQQAHRVFISHSWAYEEQYEEVESLLENAYGFEYFDHSVSQDDPIDAQLPNHLRKKLRDQMQTTDIVIVLAGMYVAHSDWIQEEIDMAADMGKPIIGVIPAENDRVPNVVEDHAAELVDADGSAVLDAIERHAT